VPARHFTHAVDDAEEDRITWQKNDVQLAVMAKQQLSKVIHGKQKIFIEKEFAEYICYCED
jgi:hypothetical protein